VQVVLFWNTSKVGSEVQAGLVYSINVTAFDPMDINSTNDTMRVHVQFLDDEYLLVSEVAPSSTDLMRGDTFNISYTVENIGSKDQDPLGDTLYLYIDNGTIGINSTAIQSLGSKESIDGLFDIDTSELSLGNHTFRLELINAQRGMETENITITYPNIYIGEVNLSAMNGTVGDIILVNATVHNNGTANATDVMVHFYVDAPYLFEAFNDTVNVSTDAQNTTTFEWNTTGLDAGNHTVKVSLGAAWDSENMSGNVTLVAGGVPDLAVTDLVVEPDVADIGQTVNISATIRNMGDWKSVATNVSFKSVKGLNSTNLGLVDIPELQPGQSIDVFHLWDTSGLEPWTYIVWVQADPEGHLVDEEVLKNNKAEANMTLVGETDLEVTSINMTKGQTEVYNISQGDKATLNIVITNIGTKKSEPTTADIFLDEAPTPLQTMKIFGLGVGGFYILQYAWDTSGVPVGNHTFKVVADAAGYNTEANEANNVADLNITVTKAPGTIDLAVLAVSTDPVGPTVGDRVIISADIKNEGTGDALNITLLFSYMAPGGGIEIDRQVIPVLGPGEDMTRTTDWSTGPLASGSYNLNVSLDPLNEVHDLDRTDNFKVLPVTLRSKDGPTGKPDLRIDNITVDKDKPKRDDKVTITVKISNIGEGNATDVRVVLLIDDLEIGTKNIPLVVKEGGTEAVTFTWTAKGGMHLIKAEVYAGTSTQYDDVRSQVLSVEKVEKGGGDYMPILLVILVILIIAIVLIATGGRGGKGPKKGFVEEDHDEDDEDADDEEE
jgi:subtilase family serine protease